MYYALNLLILPYRKISKELWILEGIFINSNNILYRLLKNFYKNNWQHFHLCYNMERLIEREVKFMNKLFELNNQVFNTNKYFIMHIYLYSKACFWLKSIYITIFVLWIFFKLIILIYCRGNVPRLFLSKKA